MGSHTRILINRLDALDETPMSVEEIEHEIDTMRAERCAHARRG